MGNKLLRTVLAAAVLAPLPTVKAAERVDADRIAACASERDEARRLACYDEAVAASKTAERELPAQSAPAAEAITESDFGVSGSAVARQRRSEQENAEDREKIKSITAVVTEVSSQARGELVITLDNGQIWMQKKSERYFPVKLGDKVTINAGMLGSYRMTNGNRITQVTRVK